MATMVDDAAATDFAVTAGAVLTGAGLLATAEEWQSALAESGVHVPIFTQSPVIPARIERLDPSRSIVAGGLPCWHRRVDIQDNRLRGWGGWRWSIGAHRDSGLSDRGRTGPWPAASRVSRTTSRQQLRYQGSFGWAAVVAAGCGAADDAALAGSAPRRPAVPRTAMALTGSAALAAGGAGAAGVAVAGVDGDGGGAAEAGWPVGGTSYKLGGGSTGPSLSWSAPRAAGSAVSRTGRASARCRMVGLRVKSMGGSLSVRPDRAQSGP